MGKSGGQAVSERIAADASISPREASVIARDLSWLGKPSPSEEGAVAEELRTLLELERGSTLVQWLEERVHYLIDNAVDLQSRASVAGRRKSFSVSGLPEIEIGQRIPVPPAGSMSPLVVLNRGAFLYLSGKKAGMTLQLKLDSFGLVEIRSPRTGILSIGEAFIPATISEAQLMRTAASVVRLGILFHEARHSDGNGASLGFLHAVCPPGHELAGINACDRNANGPYSVGAAVTRSLLRVCTDCSERDLAQIRLKYLDSLNRVIRGPNGEMPPRWDAQPESAL